MAVVAYLRVSTEKTVFKRISARKLYAFAEKEWVEASTDGTWKTVSGKDE